MLNGSRISLNNYLRFISPELLLCLLFLLHLFLSWPGVMTSDSLTQYQQAIMGVYDDHHPPLMAFVWRHLDAIHKGSGLMLLLDLLLLYGSVYFLMQSINNGKIRYLALLFPIIPQVLIYSFFIWKDVVCTFSFLFVNCYLAYLTIKDKPLSWPKALLLLPILLYGTAVKFQAQYFAFFTLGWLVLAMSSYKINYKAIIKFLMLCGIFYYSLISINNYLVPNQQKSEAWQFVKMYDIAAISVATNQPFLPDFIKLPEYSEKEMYLRFNHQSVDSLVYGEPKLHKKPILQKTFDKTKQDELLAVWRHVVILHPFYYLKHRSFNLAYSLFSRVGMGAIKPLVYEYKILYSIIAIMGYVFLAHFLGALIAIVYLGFSIYCLIAFRNSEAQKYAIPLFYFNSVGVSMLLLLFFLSMAGISRYTYITICMAHASHFFAYRCFKEFRQRQIFIENG